MTDKQIAIVQQNDEREQNLMLKIVESGNMEAFERYITLRRDEEQRRAALEFDKHFAEMQAEMPRVPRSKQSHTNKYAPLESLQEICGPIIAKHGFSYFWREEVIELGKRVTIVISGWGFSKEVCFDVPKMPGTNAMNPVQVAATLSSYGKRYTFTSGFGIIICDEDTDGNVGVREEDDETFANIMDKARLAKLSPRETAELQQRYTSMMNSKSLPKLVAAINEELDGRLVRSAAVRKAATK